MQCSANCRICSNSSSCVRCVDGFSLSGLYGTCSQSLAAAEAAGIALGATGTVMGVAALSFGILKTGLSIAQTAGKVIIKAAV